MAVKAGPVLALTAKWLLVPIALGVVGYYFVGPKIGVAPPTAKKDHSSDMTSETLDESEETSNNYPEPDVEVSVRKGTTIRRSSADRPRRTSRPKPKKEETAPKVEPEKIDEPPPVVTPPPVETTTTTGSGGGGETIPVKETTTGGGEGG